MPRTEGERLPRLSLRQIRHEAHIWIEQRQLLRHTAHTILTIAENELTELTEAIKAGEPAHIDEELCDVVFAIMCVDPRESSIPIQKTGRPAGALKQFVHTTRKFLDGAESLIDDKNKKKIKKSEALKQIDSIYAYAGKYFLGRPQRFETSMVRVVSKDITNYAYLMFEGASPFRNPKHSLETLRIMRKTIGTSGMANLWQEITAVMHRDLGFADAYALTGIFRSGLLTKLREIRKNDQFDPNLRARLKYLVKHGNWTMTPLFIEGSSIRWD